MEPAAHKPIASAAPGAQKTGKWSGACAGVDRKTHRQIHLASYCRNPCLPAIATVLSRWR